MFELLITALRWVIVPLWVVIIVPLLVLVWLPFWIVGWRFEVKKHRKVIGYVRWFKFYPK